MTNAPDEIVDRLCLVSPLTERYVAGVTQIPGLFDVSTCIGTGKRPMYPLYDMSLPLSNSPQAQTAAFLLFVFVLLLQQFDLQHSVQHLERDYSAVPDSSLVRASIDFLSADEPSVSPGLYSLLGDHGSPSPAHNSCRA